MYYRYTCSLLITNSTIQSMTFNEHCAKICIDLNTSIKSFMSTYIIRCYSGLHYRMATLFSTELANCIVYWSIYENPVRFLNNYGLVSQCSYLYNYAILINTSQLLSILLPDSILTPMYSTCFTTNRKKEVSQSLRKFTVTKYITILFLTSRFKVV